MVGTDAAVNLVMQAGLPIRFIAIAGDLDAVHPQVGGGVTGLGGTLRIYLRQGDEGAAIHGPGNQLRQLRKCRAALQHRGV